MDPERAVNLYARFDKMRMPESERALAKASPRRAEFYGDTIPRVSLTIRSAPFMPEVKASQD